MAYLVKHTSIQRIISLSVGGENIREFHFGQGSLKIWQEKSGYLVRVYHFDNMFDYLGTGSVKKVVVAAVVDHICENILFFCSGKSLWIVWGSLFIWMCWKSWLSFCPWMSIWWDWQITSAENRDPNLNRLIGLFNERSSILDRSLSHSKHVTMNLGRDYKSGTQPQLTCPTYLHH